MGIYIRSICLILQKMVMYVCFMCLIMKNIVISIINAKEICKGVIARFRKKTINSEEKQAGAELGQAQIKLELGFTLIILLN